MKRFFEPPFLLALLWASCAISFACRAADFPYDLSSGMVGVEAQWQAAGPTNGEIQHAHLAHAAPMGVNLPNDVTWYLRIVIHDDPTAVLTEVRSNNGSQRLFKRNWGKSNQPPWVGDPNGVRATFIAMPTRIPNGKQTISIAANFDSNISGSYFVETETPVSVRGPPGDAGGLGNINRNWSTGYYDWRASSWSQRDGYDREILRDTPCGQLDTPSGFAAPNHVLTFSRQGSGPVARRILLGGGHGIPGAGFWRTQAAETGYWLFDGPDRSKTRSVTINRAANGQPIDVRPGWHSVSSLMVSGEKQNVVCKTWFQVR